MHNYSFLVSVTQYIINFPVSRESSTTSVPEKSKYSQSSTEECIFQVLVSPLFAMCLNGKSSMHLYSNLELGPTIHLIWFSCEVAESSCCGLAASLGVCSVSPRGVITKPHRPGRAARYLFFHYE